MDQCSSGTLHTGGIDSHRGLGVQGFSGVANMQAVFNLGEGSLGWGSLPIFGTLKMSEF